jgi:hypothetical protein
MYGNDGCMHVKCFDMCADYVIEACMLLDKLGVDLHGVICAYYILTRI